MEVLRYKEINKGSMKAFFNLKVPKQKMIYNDMILFQKGNQRWVSFPQKMSEQNGEKKYFPYVYIEDKELQKIFNAKVLEAIDNYLKTANIEPNGNINEDIPF